MHRDFYESNVSWEKWEKQNTRYVLPVKLKTRLWMKSSSSGDSISTMLAPMLLHITWKKPPQNEERQITYYTSCYVLLDCLDWENQKLTYLCRPEIIQCVCRLNFWRHPWRKIRMYLYLIINFILKCFKVLIKLSLSVFLKNKQYHKLKSRENVNVHVVTVVWESMHKLVFCFLFEDTKKGTCKQKTHFCSMPRCKILTKPILWIHEVYPRYKIYT